jgi:hypothetical protein
VPAIETERPTVVTVADTPTFAPVTIFPTVIPSTGSTTANTKTLAPVVTPSPVGLSLAPSTDIPPAVDGTKSPSSSTSPTSETEAGTSPSVDETKSPTTEPDNPNVVKPPTSEETKAPSVVGPEDTKSPSAVATSSPESEESDAPTQTPTPTKPPSEGEREPFTGDVPISVNFTLPVELTDEQTEQITNGDGSFKESLQGALLALAETVIQEEFGNATKTREGQEAANIPANATIDSITQVGTSTDACSQLMLLPVTHDCSHVISSVP